jgi:hypothetical protein
MASTVAKSVPLEMDGARLVTAPVTPSKAARRARDLPPAELKSPPAYMVEPLLEKVIDLTLLFAPGLKP